jgi:cyanophycinase
MMYSTTIRVLLTGVFLLAAQSGNAQEPPYKYFRTGNATDVATKTVSGFALMGGGKDLDPAFEWLCKKSGGGDFLVLRATGTDAYNSYIANLCKLNSVATLVIPNKDAAMDPFVAATIRKAEVLFIAGGDQSNYVRYWRGTPVQDAINDLISRGVPVGGTSAGLAILGQFSYSALNDANAPGNLESRQALADPYNERVTISEDFLRVELLRRTITDTHFVARDRLGRLLTFMARIVQDRISDDIRGIGIDERSAALVNADGTAEIVGTGSGAYFFHPIRPPETCAKGKPLSYREISVYKAPEGATFNLTTWKGSGGASYDLDVKDGVVQQPRP